MIKNIKLNQYLDALKALKIWMPWMYEFGTHGRKIPSLNGERYATWSDRSLFMYYDEAVTLTGLHTKLKGIGFLVIAPYMVLDLDKCCIDGNLNPVASSIVDALDTYTELSPTGRGCHCLVKANLEGYTKLTVNQEGQSIEIKTPDNFVTFTGNSIRDVPIKDCTSILEAWYKDAGKDKKVHYDKPPEQTKEVYHNYDYGAKVLLDECAIVRKAVEGDRTNTLLAASRNIGQLIVDHIENPAAAIRELEKAGQSTGLSPQKCKSTVADGLAYGKKSPRINVPKPYGKLILRPK